MFKFILLIHVLFIYTDARHGRILLKDLSAITLSRDEYTTSHRSHAIPQLRCIGGSAKHSKSYYPDVVQCYNRGFDGRDVQWECEANLNKRVKFGKMKVNCEGYEYRDDPYVTINSCGLEYELNLKEPSSFSSVYKSFPTIPSSLPTNFPWIFIGGLLLTALLLWFFCLPGDDDTVGGGGGSWSQSAQPSAPYPDNDPPPYESDGYGFTGSSSASSARHRRGPPPDYYSSTSQGRGWFKRNNDQSSSSSWMSNIASTGAGFLGGYLFGSRDNAFSSRSRHHHYTPYPTQNNFCHQEPSSTFYNRHDSDSDRSPARGYASTSRR